METEVRETRQQSLEEYVKALVDTYLQERAKQRTKRLAIIASKGTLDMAYPPFILATAAAAMGWEVGIFFTFYGLNLIHRQRMKELKVAPLANPAMPMPVPNLVGALPGMTALGTAIMKRMFRSHHVASIEELVQLAREAGVKLFPCAMTAEVFGYKKDDFIDGIEEMAGAAGFLAFASEADVTIFV
jgi:peroxiredoxin family protein